MLANRGVNTMNISEDAKEYLDRLHSCIPSFFYNEIDATRRGFGFVLNYLEQADKEVYAGDLSKKLNVSTARIAALLKKMEQNGLITRNPSPEDARRTLVEITPTGIDLINEMRSHALRKIELLLNKVSKEDMETYIRISQQIKEVIDE